MGRWWVRVPVVGEVGVGLDADSEEEAIEKALYAAGGALSCSSGDDRQVIIQCEELMAVRRVVHGNIFHGPCSEIEAEEEE